MHGKLIAVDGVDASGKGLQTGLMLDALTGRGIDVVKLSFPMYKNESSALVRLYLSGGLGESPDSVNAYAASVFFAADRYASYKNDWGTVIEGGRSVVADRYATSNAVHQMVKLPRAEWDGFLDWADELEYVRLGLPRPDRVVFLDVPTEISLSLMSKRYCGDEAKKDIHEKDADYLHRCSQAAAYAAARLGWVRIDCVRDGALRSPQDIHAEVMRAVEPVFFDE